MAQGLPCASPKVRPEANVGVPPFTQYIPQVFPLGDSITEGDNALHIAGYREPLYNLAAGSLHFVGSQSFAGIDNGLAVNPQHEGHPFYILKEGGPQGSITTTGHDNIPVYKPDVIILLGGTNDIGLNGDSAATVASSMSNCLDQLWAARAKPWQRIAVCTILKRLDAFDSVVQAANALFPGVIAGKSFASRLLLINMYDAVQRPTIGQGMSDAVHPLDEGYTDMANRLWTGGLQTLLDIV